MGFHARWEDDFSGYSSQTDFEDAYPYNPPGDLSSSVDGAPNSPYVTWGLTRGPGGVPGIENTTDPMVGSGQFAVVIDKVFDPEAQCRYFAVEATFDFSAYAPVHPLNLNSAILQVWSYEYGDRLGSFDGALVNIARRHFNGNMPITIRTTPAYGNTVLPAGRYADEIIGALPNGSILHVRIEGKSSLLTESPPGTWQPSVDGYVKIFVNGSQIFSFTGPVWHGNPSTNRNWDAASVYSVGKVTNFNIYDSDECTITTGNDIPPTETNPCCGSSVDPGVGDTNPGDKPPEDTSVSYQPWIQNCAGGGLVEEIPTPSDPESWAA